MSDYLLALARRSAGIAPVVHARPVSAGPVVAGPVAAPVNAPGTPPRVPSPPTGTVERPRDIVPMATMRPEAPPRPRTEPPARSHAPESAVPQRGDRPSDLVAASGGPAVVPAPASPVASSATPVRRAAPEDPGPPIRPRVLVVSSPNPAQDAPPATSIVITREAPPDVRRGRADAAVTQPEHEARTGIAASALAPAATLRPSPPRSPDGTPAPPPAETTRRVPDEPPAVMQPAALRVGPGIEILEAASERQVDVRIGTIEIHGPEPTAHPTVPVAAAPVEPAAPASGFDSFVRLRTYAPWGR
jgi:hypothetical protein